MPPAVVETGPDREWLTKGVEGQTGQLEATIGRKSLNALADADKWLATLQRPGLVSQIAAAPRYEPAS